MSDTQFQGFPTPTTPLVGQAGRLTFTFYRLLSSLWKRTGAGGSGSAVFGAASLDPATDHGFVYIPGGAGPPSGVPENYSGQTALYADQTNKKIYAYFAGWVALN